MIIQIIIWIFWLNVQIDGNKQRNFFALADNLNKNGWFVVDLGRPHQIENIVFYQRSYCPNCKSHMANFKVGLSNNFDPQINKTLKRDYKLCAQYIGSLSSGARVVFRCQDKNTYSRYVIIQQDIGKSYLTISKLEVMGEYINYLGCFDTLMNNIRRYSKGFKDCITLCQNMNYLLAAIQNQKCICGNKTKHSLPLSECDVMCPGDVDYCGSLNRVSVYEVIPEISKELKREYIGCFVDSEVRDLAIATSDTEFMTIEKCQNLCARYSFFGVQYSSYCFCGNNYGRYGIDENSCVMKCSGNHNQICGGAYRNSVYAVYPEQRPSSFFRKTHHCKNGADLDLDGICGNKQCEDGWTGEDCTMRNCLVNNGDCGVHKCLSISGSAGILSECICKEGFDKRFWWDYCSDIDECEDEAHKCNTTISTCINKEGSYECKCFTGLQIFDVFKCKDIDECEHNECNKTTMNCHNTFGSYICKCKEGFRDENPKHCRDINECEEIPNACNLTVSNCTNTFGSFECLRLEGGYDKNNSASFYVIPGTKIFVFTLVIVLCITGIISFIKYRKNLLSRFSRIGCKIKLNRRNKQIKKSNDVQIEEAVSLIDLKDYYFLNKSRLLTFFETFPQVTDSPTTYGQNIKLREKNGGTKLIPFDHNRVVLKTLPNEDLSDYINASFIPSFQGTFQFIAAQGPMKKTEYNFWRMIFEYKVEIVVMLTNCVDERKIVCMQYWPNSSKYIKDINVTLKDIKCWSTHDIRTLVITKDKITHTVTHMLYKLWMKNKAPENIGSLLNFHHLMNSFKKQNSASPIVVHCSDGVGRTGTFLAMDRLLHEAQQTGMVDVFKCLKFLRSHRNYMIQTKIQFTVCYDSLSFYYDWGHTTTNPLNEVNVQHLILKRKFFVEKEYEWISQNTSSAKQDLMCRNNKKQLIFPGCVQNSTYKFHIESEISWQKIVECCGVENYAIIILLDDLVDKKLSDLPFVSASGNLNLTNRFPQLKINHIEMLITDFNEGVYVNGDKRNIFALSSISCEHLRHLWSLVNQFQSKEKTLLIYSNDLNRAAFVVCALNLLEMMDAVEEIDVFQIVFQMKSLIPHFMENIIQYRNLNQLLENYLTSNE